MVTSAILHEIICRLQIHRLFVVLVDMVSAMEFHLDLICCFHVILAKNDILSSHSTRHPCRSDDGGGYRPVHMYGNLKTAILEIA